MTIWQGCCCHGWTSKYDSSSLAGCSCGDMSIGEGIESPVLRNSQRGLIDLMISEEDDDDVARREEAASLVICSCSVKWHASKQTSDLRQWGALGPTAYRRKNGPNKNQSKKIENVSFQVKTQTQELTIADMGCGKSVTMSFLVDELSQPFTWSKNRYIFPLNKRLVHTTIGYGRL